MTRIRLNKTNMNIGKDNFKSKFYYLIENYDLWIWDFDLTLTKIHTYKEKLDSYIIGRRKQRDLENDFWDASFFINLVNSLILNDKQVAIVSFGSFNVIKTYLERLFGNNYVFNSKNILTPLAGDQRYGQEIPSPPNDKNQLIKNLTEKYQIDLSRTIFFDDTCHNIYQAKQLGLMAIYIPREQGFTELYLESVEKQFRNLLSQGKITSFSCPKKKDTIEPAFTHSATRFREEISIPDFRDDLEGNTQHFFYDKNQVFKQGEQLFDNYTQIRQDFQNNKIGVEGIDLPLESNETQEEKKKTIIEGFNQDKINIYWIYLQRVIEIVSLFLIVWFLYNRKSEFEIIQKYKDF